MFRDRAHAGRMLAEGLEEYEGMPGAIVFAVPRGGVVVAAEIAHALHLPLDVVVAAKVGAPGNPEYAIGAVAPDGVVTANEGAKMTAEEMRTLAVPVRDLVARRLQAFRDDRPEPDVGGKIAILADDGIATGLTVRAAAEYLRRRGAVRIVIAAPVIAPESIGALEQVSDEIVTLEVPQQFWAVGQFYEDFRQVTDA
ncbi:MAG: phosphoribosyltransferase family protein, partial [Actinomycetota bacterium]|nr:phosphoribosyltransferase family protein [Actinomycetota bacterium]